MKLLKDLIIYVTRNGKSLTKLDYSFIGETDSLYVKLFKGIASGKVNNDREAVKYLYNEDKLSTKYRALKSRFKDRCLNNLMYVDHDFRHEEENLYAIRTAAYQKLAFANILIYKRQFNLGDEIFKDVLKVSKKYGFCNLAIECFYNLIESNCLLNTPKTFRAFCKDYNYYIDLFTAEASVKISTAQFYNRSSNSIIDPNEELHVKKKLIQSIAIVQKKYEKSYIINVHNMGLRANYFLMKKDYEKTFETLDTYKQFLDSNPNLKTVFRYSLMALYKIRANYEQKDFEGVYRTHNEFINHHESETETWEQFVNYYVLSLFKEFQIEKIAKFLEKNYKYLVDNNTDRHITSRWKVKEAYLIWIIQSTAILVYNPIKNKKFDIHKFLGNLTEPVNFKLSLNAATLIIECLFYLKRKELSKLIDKEDALKMYAHRHLKAKQATRVRMMFHLIGLIIQSNFEYETVLKKSKKYLRVLKNFEVEPYSLTYDYEIIPYEKLWEYCLQILKNRKPI